MISRWLANSSLDWFVDTHYGREPLVRPDTARSAIPLLDWETVEELVTRGADVIVVRNGVPRPGPAPRSFGDALSAFADGFSLVLRGCETHAPRLRDLAEAVATELPGEIAVQAFVTPAGYGSFGWHYDCEDVFIVQTAGVKEYVLRRNTVNPHPTIDAMPRDMHFERERSPVLACTLVPGDWLYVPRGFWHRARAAEDSLSLSIGVLGSAARGLRPPARRVWERG